MDTVERIFYLLNERKMEQKEFAAKIGVSENVVSTWRTGRTKSFSRYLSKIAEVLSTSPEYLLTGSEAEPVPASDPELAAALSQFEKLTPEQRAKVIGYMEGLISSR